jgi:hypothetical protein
MALSPQKLQKKRAKKVASRRSVKSKSPHVPDASINTRGNWLRGISSPIHEVCTNENLFQGGMGTLVFCRKTPDQHCVVVMFLLDTYCLGVKKVVQSVMTPEQYSDMKLRLEQSHGARFLPTDPRAARRLLDDLVAWSRQLGFEPASEYEAAAKILGDTPPATDELSFTFGMEGKPFYISGPRDSPARSKRIVDQLEKKCGLGGFDYMISGPGGF